MMDVTQFATDLVEASLILTMEANLDKIAEYCQKNDDQLSKSFCDSFQILLQKGMALQKAGKLGEVAYLAISVLRTFIMERRLQLRLDLYDATYFLSKVECSAYLDVAYIFKYIDSDINALVADLKECGGKFNSIEVDELKKDYIDTYSVVAQTFIAQNVPAILGLSEYGLLRKTGDFKIIYGEYLDRTVTIYDAAAIESGAES
jgi:hypothetical protein